MKANDILQINSKIELLRQHDDTVYKSLIEDVWEGVFLIGAPVHKRHQLVLHKGDILTMTTFSGSACFNFVSEVLGTKQEKGLLLYIIKKPQKFEKLERRNFVRVEVALEVSYEIITDQKNWDKIELSQKAFSIDLSGGGIQIMLPRELPGSSLVALNLPIDVDGSDTALRLLGRVVRIEEKNINGTARFKTGIKFEEISEREMDIIIKFIFSQIRKTMHLRWSDS